jgi:hypothetical protein
MDRVKGAAKRRCYGVVATTSAEVSPRQEAQKHPHSIKCLQVTWQAFADRFKVVSGMHLVSCVELLISSGQSLVHHS